MSFTDTITPQNVIFTAGIVVIIAWILEKLKRFSEDFRSTVGKIFEDKLHNGFMDKITVIIKTAIKEHEERFDARLDRTVDDHEARIRKLENKDGPDSR